MYIDHDIIIEETLPAMLQENIADLERYYAEDTRCFPGRSSSCSI